MPQNDSILRKTHNIAACYNQKKPTENMNDQAMYTYGGIVEHFPIFAGDDKKKFVDSILQSKAGWEDQSIVAIYLGDKAQIHTLATLGGCPFAQGPTQDGSVENLRNWIVQCMTSVVPSKNPKLLNDTNIMIFEGLSVENYSAFNVEVTIQAANWFNNVLAHRVANKSNEGLGVYLNGTSSTIQKTETCFMLQLFNN